MIFEKYINITSIHFQISSTKRLVNSRRQKKRPKCPTSLEDMLMTEHIPDDFLIGDVWSPDKKARHIILSSKKQLRVLGTRQIIYIDGTFRVNRLFPSCF